MLQGKVRKRATGTCIFLKNINIGFANQYPDCNVLLFTFPPCHFRLKASDKDTYKRSDNSPDINMLMLHVFCSGES